MFVPTAAIERGLVLDFVRRLPWPLLGSAATALITPPWQLRPGSRTVSATAAPFGSDLGGTP
jgi:hypothetical protein